LIGRSLLCQNLFRGMKMTVVKGCVNSVLFFLSFSPIFILWIRYNARLSEETIQGKVWISMLLEADFNNTKLLSVTHKTEFAVEMTCQSCVDDITTVLQAFPDINHFEVDLSDQRVTIEGTGNVIHVGNPRPSSQYSFRLCMNSSTFQDITSFEGLWTNSDCAWSRRSRRNSRS
jgi:copper chaperone CopZ